MKQKRWLLFSLSLSLPQFGARIENMDDVIEQVISEVRNRHKRSLWGNILSWFNEETTDDKESDDKNPTSRPTQPSTKGTAQPSTKHTSFAESRSSIGYRRSRTKASTRPTARSSTRPTSKPTGSQKPSTQQRPTFPSSDGQSVSC